MKCQHTDKKRRQEQREVGDKPSEELAGYMSSSIANSIEQELRIEGTSENDLFRHQDSACHGTG